MFDCRPHSPLDKPLRETGGEGIDGLDQRETFVFFGRDYVVGMRHLKAAIEDFEPAAYQSPFSLRKQLLKPSLFAAKEDELKLVMLVPAEDPPGRAGSRRLMMADHLHLKGCDSAGLRLCQGWAIAAVDQSRGQMPAEVHNTGTGQALKEFGQARAHAG